MSKAHLALVALFLANAALELGAQVHKKPELQTYPLALYDKITWMHRRCTTDPVCKPSDSIVAQGSYLSNGDYQLLADGKDFYWAWDRGAFAYLKTRGDFAMTAKLKSSAVVEVGTWAFGTPADVFAKWGLMAREKLTCTSRMAGLMWDEYWSTCRRGKEPGCTAGNYGMSWFWRNREGLEGVEKSCSPGDGLLDNTVPNANKLTDLYARIERKQNKLYFKYRYGATGEWQSVNPVRRDGTPEPVIVLQSNELFVGLAAATGGASFECDAGKGCTKAHWRRKLSKMIFADVEFEGEIVAPTDVSRETAHRTPGGYGIAVAGRRLILRGTAGIPATITLQDYCGRRVFSGSSVNTHDGALMLPSRLARGCYLAEVKVNATTVVRAPVSIGH